MFVLDIMGREKLKSLESKEMSYHSLKFSMSGSFLTMVDFIDWLDSS